MLVPKIPNRGRSVGGRLKSAIVLGFCCIVLQPWIRVLIWIASALVVLGRIAVMVRDSHGGAVVIVGVLRIPPTHFLDRKVKAS